MLSNPFKKNGKVVFWTDNQFLLSQYPIISSNKILPEWFKELTPKFNHSGIRGDALTVKRSPGIMRYLNYGYVVRTWTDIIITTDMKHGNVHFEYTENEHNTGRKNVFSYLGLNKPVSLMADHTFGIPSALPNAYFKNVLKWSLGWHAWMPNGYDLWFAPMQYHFNPHFTPTTGILDTRITEQLNVQIFWHPQEEKVLIPAGTPLVQLIPVKRDELDFTIEADETRLHEYRLKEKFARYWLKFTDKLNFMNYKYFNDDIDDVYRKKYKEKK